MTELIDGVGINLCPSAPKRVHAQLQNFRLQVAEARTPRLRAQLERRVESYLEAKPCTRAAARRYIRPKLVNALSEAYVLLHRAKAFLKKHEET